MGKNIKRKIVLINRPFQIKLILKFIVLNSLIMLVFGFFVYLFFNSEIQANLHSAHVTYKNVKDMLLPIMITLSVINILISSFIITIFVLFASHKLAGPLYRFNQALTEIITNKNFQAHTNIRKGDQFYNVSILLKNMTEVLSQDLLTLKSRLAELKDQIKGEKNKDEIFNKIKELDDIINQYNILEK